MHDFLDQVEKREIQDAKYYIYIIFGVMPMYVLFVISFYFMATNIGYNTIPAILYLWFGLGIYMVMMKQIN